jgi:hypothetical protein
MFVGQSGRSQAPTLPHRWPLPPFCDCLRAIAWSGAVVPAHLLVDVVESSALCPAPRSQSRMGANHRHKGTLKYKFRRSISRVYQRLSCALPPPKLHRSATLTKHLIDRDLGTRPEERDWGSVMSDV